MCAIAEDYYGGVPTHLRRYPEDYYGVYVFTEAIRRSVDRCAPARVRDAHVCARTACFGSGAD